MLLTRLVAICMVAQVAISDSKDLKKKDANNDPPIDDVDVTSIGLASAEPGTCSLYVCETIKDCCIDPDHTLVKCLSEGYCYYN